MKRDIISLIDREKVLLNARENERLIYGDFVQHDHAACNALKEYDRLYQPWDRAKDLGLPTKGIPRPNMQQIAEKYKTTITEMKRHYKCLGEEKPGLISGRNQ